MKAVMNKENVRKTLRLMRRNYDLYLLLLPAIIYLIIFCYVPMAGVQIAFKNYMYTKGIWGSPWVGFDNFTNFFKSYYFGQILSNTLTISIQSMLIGFPIPIIMALFLNQMGSKGFKRTVQTITYAPNFISTVVIVGMLVLFLNPRTGIVNNMLVSLGLPSNNFLSNPKYFRSIYISSGVWQGSGFAMIVYLGALAGVNPELYDAADIDGATRMQRLLYIDLATIMPTITILFIMSMGGIMNVGFEKIYLLQNPLNESVSEVISTYVYKVGLLRGDQGFATAIGLFNTAINFVLLIIVNQVSKRVSETSLW